MGRYSGADSCSFFQSQEFRFEKNRGGAHFVDANARLDGANNEPNSEGKRNPETRRITSAMPPSIILARTTI